MNIRISPRQGSTVALVLVITGVIGITLASYLNLTSSQHRSVMYSLSWNAAMPMAEAGVEEALTQLARSSGTNLAVDGWTASGTNYTKSRTFSSGYYEVTISGTSNFSINSRGFVRRPDTTNYASRTVHVGTTRQYRYVGMIAKVLIRLGGGMDADSYDSSDPLYSTNGIYDSTKHKDNSFIATNSQTNNSIIMGNAIVLGKVATGPGGTISVGGSSSVGDFGWGGAKGIEPGHSSDDMNVNLPEVVVPFPGGLPTGPGKVDGTNYNYMLAGGNYTADSLNGSIVVSAPSALYVKGNADLSKVVILPGAKLDIYVGGASTTLNGGDIVNGSGVPSNLNYYGLPSNTNIKFNGNSVFVGTVYAPNAEFTGGGKASVYGAMTIKSITTQGDFSFHYDEALGNGGPSFGILITSWNEI